MCSTLNGIHKPLKYLKAIQASSSQIKNESLQKSSSSSKKKDNGEDIMIFTFPDTYTISQIFVDQSNKKTLFELFESFAESSNKAKWEITKDMESSLAKTKREYIKNNKYNAKVPTSKRKLDETEAEDQNKSIKLLEFNKHSLELSRFTIGLHDLETVGLLSVKATKPGIDSTVSISNLITNWEK